MEQKRPSESSVRPDKNIKEQGDEKPNDTTLSKSVPHESVLKKKSTRIGWGI